MKKKGKFVSKLHIHKWTDLFSLSLEINSSIKIITNLIIANEELLLEMAKKLDERKLSELKNIEQELKLSYEMSNFYHEEIAINSSISTIRKSMLVTIFTFFESNLLRISKLAEAEFKPKIKINDLSGNDYIHQYWIYLTKVIELDKTKYERYYTPIKQQKVIRNKISHHNGKLDNSASDKLKNIITETEGLTVQDNYIMILDSKYLKNLLEKSRLFFEHLLKELDLFYSSKSNNVK